MRLGRTGPRETPQRSPGTAAQVRVSRRRSAAARPSLGGTRPSRWPFGRRRLTPPRAAAILGVLASVGALYGLATTPAFVLTRTELPVLRWTTTDALVRAIATPDGANLFQIRTGPIEDRLRALPAVAAARVSVSLPDTLVVEVDEREAILAWGVGESRSLVDREGVVFAVVDAGSGAMAAVPTIVDSRPGSTALTVGSMIDPVELDAARRLGSLTPDTIGSGATSLVTTVNEATGFVVGTVPRSWVAIFGLYTPTLRTPAIIPGQVRLLRSLLAGREARIDKVILADQDRGTYVLKETDAP
ncbi:MAG: FtsQ-type POTRA domain-containing protein [Chloroflexi bacterium]|nr:FtsQ-type POTRA domain-containing protein [Chloroflexota bacterium]